MKVLITGANGFIGQNLQLCLLERQDIEGFCFTRQHTEQHPRAWVAAADFIFQLAAVHRPQDPREFLTGNTELTETLCAAIIRFR
jgi:UDP-2-acetamido-2,6-beta-L-arabino-hexul-4-ose reductase